MNATLNEPPARGPAEHAAAPEPESDLIQRVREGLLPMNDLMAYVEQLQSQGQLQAACNLYGLWLQASTDPRRHLVYFNFGTLLQSQGQTEQAVLAYQASLSLNPLLAQASINLGLSHERLGNNDQALQAWAQVVGQRSLVNGPSVEMQTLALNHMGRLQEQLKHYQQAEQALEDSLRINPLQPGAIQHWVHIRQKACQWPVYKPLPGISLGAMLRATSPLAMLALSDDPLQQLLTAQSFVARTYSFKEEQLYDGRSYRHPKLRIGYVSADLREHAVGFLLPAFFQGHDLQRYELYGYDYSQEEPSAVRQQLKGMFSHWRSIHQLSDRQAAELMLQDEIDILIDLHGLSSGARPGIFALHPAPRQGTYLGFIGTTGMPWFDFVLADQQVLPPELAVHFTERPVYLESSFLPLAATAPSLPDVSRVSVGLPEDAFVMAAFGNVYKITPQMFQVWMKLLQRIPKSLVWLIDDNPQTTANLRAEAAKAQVDPDRLIFAERTDHLHFCARLALADVYLDTYPYNCGSTSRDVIEAGVPLVTLYGDTMVSRMGLSILHSVRCEHLAVTNVEDYENKVVELYLKKGTGTRPNYIAGASARVHSALAQLDEPTPALPASGSHQTLGRRKGKTSHGGEPAPTSAGGLSARLPASPAPLGAAPTLRLYQIGRDEAGQASAPAQFMPLDHSSSQRPDWGGYWPMRQFLLSHTLEDNCFYGFLSADLAADTGLDHPAISAFVKQHGECHELLGLSPFWDLSSLFLNPFTQADAWHPGVLQTAQQFCDAIELDLDLAREVMHSENTIFGNYFVAKKRFWLHWLELSEKLFAIAENPDAPLHSALNSVADSQRQGASGDSVKQIIQERLVCLLLLQGRFAAKAMDMFALKQSLTPLNAFYDEAVAANALKQRAAAHPGGPELSQFRQLQQRIGVSQPFLLGPQGAVRV